MARLAQSTAAAAATVGLALALAAFAPAQASASASPDGADVSPPFSWDSCGTRYDRLKTDKLTFDVTPGLQAGATGRIHTEGTADLHAPLDAGAWQIRVYETSEPHAIYNTFGDLTKALHWSDAKHTAYTMDVSYTLPAAQGSGNFTVSLISTDQSHATYNCLELHYVYAPAGAAGADAGVEGVAGDKRLKDVDCGGGWSCQDGQTCCTTVTGSYACCATANATCCADHEHCCPDTYPICNEASGSCSKSTEVAGDAVQGQGRTLRSTYAQDVIEWIARAPATFRGDAAVEGEAQ